MSKDDIISIDEEIDWVEARDIFLTEFNIYMEEFKEMDVSLKYLGKEMLIALQLVDLIEKRKGLSGKN